MGHARISHGRGRQRTRSFETHGKQSQFRPSFPSIGIAPRCRCLSVQRGGRFGGLQQSHGKCRQRRVRSRHGPQRLRGELRSGVSRKVHLRGEGPLRATFGSVRRDRAQHVGLEVPIDRRGCRYQYQSPGTRLGQYQVARGAARLRMRYEQGARSCRMEGRDRNVRAEFSSSPVRWNHQRCSSHGTGGRWKFVREGTQSRKL
mmetsp:Transcript_3976/g.7399  ORF Transcript_3976/g.7399 Transcript_3976/m.7399 type:complete len:202 (-) Transcript_3976:184-789(-)